jgi:hypothetical protein
VGDYRKGLNTGDGVGRHRPRPIEVFVVLCEKDKVYPCMRRGRGGQGHTEAV